MNLSAIIRDVPNFPKPGILFKDVTPLLASPEAFGFTIARLSGHFATRPIDAIAAAEARGFLFAAPMAIELRKPLIPLRKPGKLPYQTHSFKYDLEYGSDILEMHADAIVKGQRVLIVDDVLATGGTMKACCDLVKHLEGEIAGIAVLTELVGLRGKDKIFTGRIDTLRRIKDDVREVAQGFECGISLDGFSDIKEKDIVESYEIEEVKQRL